MIRRLVACSSLAVLCHVALGCGGGTETNPIDENAAPTWTDAPSVLHLSEGGEAILNITATDADGDTITVTVDGAASLTKQLDGNTLAISDEIFGDSLQETLNITLSDAVNAPVTISLSVSVDPLTWQESLLWAQGDGPEEREHTTAIVDRAGRQAFVIYGSGYKPQFQQMFDDVWRLDLDQRTWTLVTPTGELPPPSGSRRFAGTEGEGVGYLFGGYSATGQDAELHRVEVQNGTLNFQKITQTGAPTARSLHAFGYDPVDDRCILFGGIANTVSSISNETYELKVNGTTGTWTQLSPANAPSPRYGSFTGFDQKTGRLIVFSGAQAPTAGSNGVNAATDTWVLDTRATPLAWTEVTIGGSPFGRRNGSGAWDEDRSRLYVFGGTADGATTAPGLFMFDARPGHEQWHVLERGDAPALRSSGLGFYDGHDVLVGFGNGNSGIHADLHALGYAGAM